MITFSVEPTDAFARAELVYNPTEYAFGCEPRPPEPDSSVTINTLNLMVDRRNSRVVYVDGYCPHFGWRETHLTPPTSSAAALHLHGVQLKPGVGHPLLPNDPPWPVYVDRGLGWLCLGSPTETGRAIEFVSGCIALIADGQLRALWLHPRELPPRPHAH